MAIQTDEIVVRFKTEGAETVEEAFKRNATAADRYHQQITKTGGALGDLRLKAEARVANNIGAIAQAMTGGASAGQIFATAITKVSESFRGSLLFAGAATVGYALYEGITRAGDAIITLDANIAKLKSASLIPGQFLGLDQINQNLTASVGNIDQLHQRIISLQATIKQFSPSGGATGLGASLSNPIGSVISGILGLFKGKAESELQEAQAAAAGALDQLADKQETLNDAAREGISGDEKQAVLDAARADHLERLHKLAEQQVAAGIAGTPGAGRQGATEDNRANLVNTAIEKRFSIQEQGFEVARNLVNIEKELLPPAEENLKILDARIAGVQEILATEHLLTEQETDQYRIQLGQLEATKQRAEFARQLETDLAGLELGRTRGEVGSNRAVILERQRLADQAAAQNPNSPESQRAQAGLENEQFAQFQEYEKNPSAFRQKRINEQHERERFQYLRATGQLSSDIASSGSDIRTPDQRKAAAGSSGNDLPSKIDRLIQTLLALPQKIGVG